MKRSIVSCAFAGIALMLCASELSAQVPSRFMYQAVARNTSGAPLINQPVSLRFSILHGTAAGGAEYVETQSATTSALGLFNVAVGAGAVVRGNMRAIDWSSADHFLQVECDPSGGSAYVMMGTTQLLSVPYALAAGNHRVRAAGAPWITDSVTVVADGALTAMQSGDTIHLSYNASGDNDWIINGANMTAVPSGNVGIGAAVPGAKLDVTGAADAVHATGSRGMVAVGTGGVGVDATGSTSGAHFVGNGTYGIDVTGATSGARIAGNGGYGIDVTGSSSGARIAGNGGFGIDVSGSTSGAHVVGTAGVGIDATGSTTGAHIVGTGGVGVDATGSSDGVHAHGSGGLGVDASGNTSGVRARGLVHGVLVDQAGATGAGVMVDDAGAGTIAGNGVTAILRAGNNNDALRGDARGTGRGIYASSAGGFGALLTSASIRETDAAVHATGAGTNNPGVPNAAALAIDNGAITVTGTTRPVGAMVVPIGNAVAVLSAAFTCPGPCLHAHIIGWSVNNIVLTNDLIKGNSYILLTVLNTTNDPVFATVKSQGAGSATIQVTGITPNGPPGITAAPPVVTYMIVNPE